MLAVSEGWVLYRPNRQLSQVTTGQMNIGSQFQVALRCAIGRSCRMEDHQRDFRNLVDDANRANVSFYPLDPRGLVVFDQSLVHRVSSTRTSTRATAPRASSRSRASRRHRRHRHRQQQRHRPGPAARGGRPDVLLPARATTRPTPSWTGASAPSRCGSKRPGIDLRYRRGYRAATKEEVASRAAAAPVPGARLRRPSRARVSSLSKIRADAVVHAQGGYTWVAAADGAVRPTLWLFGEWDPTVAARDEQWKAGADVTVVVTAPDRTALDTRPPGADPRGARVRRAGAGARRPDGGRLQRAHHDQARGDGARHDRDAAHRRAQVACRRRDGGRPADRCTGAVRSPGRSGRRPETCRFRRQERVKVEVGGHRADDGQRRPPARPHGPSARRAGHV